MRNINELIELDYGMLLVLVLSILMFVVSTLVHVIIHLIFAPMFRLTPTNINAFGFRFYKNGNGKWEYTGYKFYLGFSTFVGINRDKFKEADAEKMTRSEHTFLILTMILEVAVAAGALAAGFGGGVSIASDFLAAASIISGIAFFVFVMVRAVITFYVLIKMNSKKSLGGYHQNAVTMIRAGVPFEKLDLKSIPELNYKNPSATERMMYFPIYFSYLDASGQYDKMAAAVGNVEEVIKPSGSTQIDVMVYLTLVYYYSYFYPDTSKAKDYYHRPGDLIEKDNDVNTMRIKGFYNLNCFGDVAKARECARSAMEGIDNFSIGSERDYERFCIAKLNDAISRFQMQ